MKKTYLAPRITIEVANAQHHILSASYGSDGGLNSMTSDKDPGSNGDVQLVNGESIWLDLWE